MQITILKDFTSFTAICSLSLNFVAHMVWKTLYMYQLYLDYIMHEKVLNWGRKTNRFKSYQFILLSIIRTYIFARFIISISRQMSLDAITDGQRLIPTLGLTLRTRVIVWCKCHRCHEIPIRVTNLADFHMVTLYISKLDVFTSAERCIQRCQSAIIGTDRTDSCVR